MCRGPTKSWPSSATAGAGTPAGRWERVPRAYRKCDSFSDFWKALCGGAPGGDSPQCRQRRPGRPRTWSAGTKPCAAVLPEETHRSVDKGDRAHGALVQNPVPVHCALRPRDPLLLQEKLVARNRMDPLVHRRVQPLMLRVHASGHEHYFIVYPDHNILKSKYLYS